MQFGAIEYPSDDDPHDEAASKRTVTGQHVYE
jgi:hypothetical protein